jgi:hypothetical protein
MHQPGSSAEFVSTPNTCEVLRMLVSLKRELSQLEPLRIRVRFCCLPEGYDIRDLRCF